MAPNPDAFIAHLREKGYNSRSDKHSNALAEAIVQDLLQRCPPIAQKASEGRLVYDLNFTIINGTGDDWNIDLVIGEPPFGELQHDLSGGIVKTPPSTIQIAIELKAIMTEHHKAARNRKRDFEAHHANVHQYNPAAIAGGVVIVNGSETFLSPLRRDGKPTIHRDPPALVGFCTDQMRAVRARPGNENGLDARAVIVVDYDNIDQSRTRFITKRPAPQVGDPLHYDYFIQQICNLYRERFP